MAHRGLQSVPHHVLVFSDEEASLCNHSQLQEQVLPGVIWQRQTDALRAHHPEQPRENQGVMSAF